MEQIQNYSNRNYMIFNTSELNAIDFNEVLETSAQWVRLSANGQKTFVKWEGGVTPNSIQSLASSVGPYTYDEITVILSTAEWVAVSPT